MEEEQKTEEEIKELEKRIKSLKQKSYSDKGNPYIIPSTILIVGVLIAGAIIFSGSQNGSLSGQPSPPPDTAVVASAIDIKPIGPEDHIQGDPNAPVKLIEFSDTECPFCKKFHPTVQQIVDDYDGEVAWVYRHYPLDAIHSKARREAAATELAAEIGGNDAFWAYLNRIFEITPSNDGLDLSLLPQIAVDVGLDRAPFEALLLENDIRGGKYAAHIEDDFQQANAAGARGTPYSVVVAPNGKTFPISGAQTYSAVKAVIDIALKEK